MPAARRRARRRRWRSLAAREALIATPALARWLGAAVEPARGPRHEGYVPSAAELRRLAAAGAAALLLARLVVVRASRRPGAGPCRPGAWRAGASACGASATAARSRPAIPGVAIAIADAMAGGRSVRAALVVACASLEGPAGVEMARVAADLELGASVESALRGMRRAGALAPRRCARRRADLAAVGGRRSDRACCGAAPRPGSSASACLRRPLGDRAGPLHGSPGRRDAGRARACSPSCCSPGFVSGLLADGISTALVLAAAALQIAGFFAIRRLSRVAPP